MPSVVERVRACGLPPPAGISYALNTPDWSLVTRIERSSGEKEAPNMAVVFMNCSIVYRGTGRAGRAGRALCVAAVPGITLASARSGRVTARYKGGRRTGRSGGGRSNVPPFVGLDALRRRGQFCAPLTRVTRISPDDRHEATVCYVCSRGKVLLQRRAAGRVWAGPLNGPGGKIAGGETATAAILREVREETGLGLDALRPAGAQGVEPKARLLSDLPQDRRRGWFADSDLAARAVEPAGPDPTCRSTL